MEPTKQIRQFNETLGREFGFRYGRPRYCWMWSDKLTMPMPAGNRVAQTPGGIYYVETKHEQMKQIEGEPRWVLALLEEPPSEARWAAMFGTDVPYPGRGIYVDTDIRCLPGVIPTQELNDFIVAAMKESLGMHVTEKRQKLLDAARRRERESEARLDDAIDNVVMDNLNRDEGCRKGDFSAGGI
jgi:hypothetical protein